MIERSNPYGLSTPPGYSHVVVASGSRLVTTAGAVPLDAAGNLVGIGDHLAQARQVLDNLKVALEAAGATGRDVVKTTVYVVSENRADLATVWSAVRESEWRTRRAPSWASRCSATRASSSRSKPSPSWSSGHQGFAFAQTKVLREDSPSVRCPRPVLRLY